MDGARDIDVFLVPQATFNMAIGQSFNVEDDNGQRKTYRIHLDDFYVMDDKNKKLDAILQWNQKKDAVSIETNDILPSQVDMKVLVSVSLEESVNGQWIAVKQNGKAVTESKSASFKTGEAPNYIPLTNIEYCYPVINQQNFFTEESTNGYIQLKRGQAYLFPEGFLYKTVYSVNTNETARTDFVYNAADKQLKYTFPNLNQGTNYGLSFIALSKNQSQTTDSIRSKTTITDAEKESYTLDITQQAAQKITQNGSLAVLNYVFKTSKFRTLAGKLDSFSFVPAQCFENDDTRSLYLKTNSNYELFEPAELVGTPYTGNQSLIRVEAVLTDEYYRLDIAPIYDGYPIAGIVIANRDVNIYDAPPYKAFYLYDNYLNTVVQDDVLYDADLSKTFPYVYRLPYHYKKDYEELFNKATNYKIKYPNQWENISKLQPLLSIPHFPFIREGKYPVKFDYLLPGNKQGTTKGKVIDFVNTLNWRQ
jgi:hypothetical protein